MRAGLATIDLAVIPPPQPAPQPTAPPASRLRPRILELLRAGTREAHDRIELNPVMGRLTRDDLDLEHYTLVLRRMLTLHAAVEGRLAAALANHRDDLALDARRKTPLLRRDLIALGATAWAEYPPQALAELVVDEPSAWGTLYVLEGSTLGGRIILRSIERSLGLTTDTGAAFFSGYGERTGHNWGIFVDALTAAHRRAPHWEDAIVASACACFAVMDDWLATGA